MRNIQEPILQRDLPIDSNGILLWESIEPCPAIPTGRVKQNLTATRNARQGGARGESINKYYLNQIVTTFLTRRADRIGPWPSSFRLPFSVLPSSGLPACAC